MKKITLICGAAFAVVAALIFIFSRIKLHVVSDSKLDSDEDFYLDNCC